MQIKGKEHKSKLNLIKDTWRFNDSVAENFDVHVRQSIPHYNELQNYLVQLSEWYLKDGTNIYDLGCSTGETIKKINKLKISTKFSIIGVDNSKKMLKLAEKKLLSIKKRDISVSLQHEDLTKIKNFKKSNLFYSILLFPFFSFKERTSLLKKIYNSLEHGGALISVEKIRSSSSQFEDILNQLYFDFKLKQKLNEKDILAKAKSLRSSMYLLDEKRLFKTIKNAGFKEYEIFFKCFNFIGYIAIK